MEILQLATSNPVTPLKPSLNSCFLINKTATTLHFRTSHHRFITKASSSSPKNEESSSSVNRRHFMAESLSLTLLISYQEPARSDEPPALADWERVFLPIDPGVVLLDTAFVPDDTNHGFLLGTRQTLLETKDGGNTWLPRLISSAEDEDFNYRNYAIIRARNGETFSACAEYELRGCHCPYGFRGDGYNCEDVNECKDGLACQCDGCQCTNTWGSYECKCKGNLLYITEHDTCIDDMLQD